jgi:CheY-like chemotaxis protein
MSQPLIGVAASADRFDALLEFLAALEHSRHWSMVVAIHAADLLPFDVRDAMQCVCDVPVAQAVDGAYLQPGVIQLLPCDRVARFSRSCVTLSPRTHALESGAVLADDLLGALATLPAPHGIGVVLCPASAQGSGMSALRNSCGLVFLCNPGDPAGARDVDCPASYRTHSPSAVAIELGELFRHPYSHEVVRRGGASLRRDRRGPAILEHKRVLVVGRNANAERPMEKLLESWGHQVVTATNMLDAVELAESLQPEVSFIEVTEPEFPGHDICHRLRRRQADSENLLVGVVRNEDPDEQLAALSAGFHALLSDQHDEGELRWLLASHPGATTPGRWLLP